MPVSANEAQKKALAAMRFSSDNRMLTVMPPGSGKTYLAALHAKEMDAKSVLYIAHLREILDQAEESFYNVFQDIIPKESFGHVDGQNKDYGAAFCFASIQTIGRPHHFDKLMEAHNNHFDYVVVDEYHHSRAETYDLVINNLKGKFDTFLGITATPYRTDGKDVFHHVGGNVIFEMNLKAAMEAGYLVPFKYYAYFDNIDYRKIQWQQFNYNQKQLDKAYSIPQRDARIIREYKNLQMGPTHEKGRLVKRGKQTLGFCVSVKHAERMAVQFAIAGVKSAVLSHKTDLKIRKEVVQEFRDGKIQAIFTRDLFNEGIDFPEVECIILLRPTISKSLFYQQIGRGLRKKEGKSHVVIMDFIGNFRRNFEVNRWIKEIGAEEEDFDKEDTDIQFTVPKVRYQKELIDFWAAEAKKNQYIKNTIIKAYQDLRQKLHRPPVLKELYKATNYNVLFYFGTFLDLMKAAGENENLIKMMEHPTPIAPEQIEAYHKYLKKSGRRLE